VSRAALVGFYVFLFFYFYFLFPISLWGVLFFYQKKAAGCGAGPGAALGPYFLRPNRPITSW
jgi:hypothetical protein